MEGQFVTFHSSLISSNQQASRSIIRHPSSVVRQSSIVCCHRCTVSALSLSHLISDLPRRMPTPLNQSSLPKEHFDSNPPNSILGLKKATNHGSVGHGFAGEASTCELVVVRGFAGTGVGENNFRGAGLDLLESTRARPITIP
ncbi:hypothetical protein Q3G72_034874 [Acer saccharum]|nr:hypothetical protein Q3G72_034874 [Acer saccharum]